MPPYYRSQALAALLLLALGGSSSSSSSFPCCHAFVGSSGEFTGTARTTTSGSSLHAVLPPPLIIGPMIKKMRAAKAKENAPLASDAERTAEAPGLRVGGGAWKWPPVWPYEAEMFQRPDEVAGRRQKSALQGMLNMPDLPAAPGGGGAEEAEGEGKLDLGQYWSEKAGVATDIDEEAADKLRSHYSYYLRDGMSVLEFGAAEDSYLPGGLRLGRHVGVGLSVDQMAQNGAITETLEVDLNNVVAENGVDSDELRALGASSFDAILMANTLDFLENPREVYKSAWQLLKPGGIMMVAFTSRDAYSDKFGKAQTKMWSTFNDDQHMWIAGSCFQFSAGDGWEGLKGFDISPEGVKMDDGNGPLSKLFDRSKGMPMYVVQARKGVQDEAIDEADPEKSIRSKMWMLPTMEERDKTLVAPRLARSFQAAKTEEERRLIGEHVDTLPTIYESLVKMDQFAFTFGMQAQLAADLARDPDFSGNEEQIRSLKEGLGLRTPGDDFWMPVGTLTANMDPEDKVNLLSHIVPRFGSGSAEQETALQTFVAALTPTFATIKAKCPDMSDGDVQLLGTELLAAEILQPGRSTRAEFAAWLGATSDADLTAYLGRRKAFKEDAVAERKAMQAERAAEEARVEAEKEKMMEQARKAREERTMQFNPENGKMEEIKK